MSMIDRVLGVFRQSSEVAERKEPVLTASGVKASVSVDSAFVRRGDGVWEAFTGMPSGGAPSEGEAMTLTAVSACVTLISGAIAALPMHIYRRAANGDLTQDYNHDLWWTLNEEFCPRWSAAAGWSFITASKLLHGDGYAEILRGRNGEIRGLVPLHPSRVKPIATPDGARLIYEVQPDPTIQTRAPEASGMRVLDQDDVLHVPGFGFNGLNGLSALRYSLRSSGRLAIAAQDFSSSFLQNMGRPDFVLKTASNLDDAQFDQLKDRLSEHLGPKNSGRPMILEGGLDIKELTMPLEDMQLIETRKFQVEEIARAFNVPPFMIGHTEKTSSWGTGVEAMGAGFVRYTLRDHLNAFHNEINRKLFRTVRYRAEFDTFELERGDIKSMFEAVRVGIGRAGEPAVVSVPEARRMLRFPTQMEGQEPMQTQQEAAQ